MIDNKHGSLTPMAISNGNCGIGVVDSGVDGSSTHLLSERVLFGFPFFPYYR